MLESALDIRSLMPKVRLIGLPVELQSEPVQPGADPGVADLRVRIRLKQLKLHRGTAAVEHREVTLNFHM